MWNVIGHGMRLFKGWLFVNVKCYWPRSETRKSLLFANVKCYWPRSETRKSLLFANVKCYWPRSETRKSLFSICKCGMLLASECNPVRVCYLQMWNVIGH